VEHVIAVRHGGVYLDPFRNAFAQTVMSPYSVGTLCHEGTSAHTARLEGGDHHLVAR
jgi:DNA primase